MDQQIVFQMNSQSFSVSVMETNRIIPLGKVIKLPDTSEYILGIMEAEEDILPVIDLSHRLLGSPIDEEQKEEAQVLVVYWKEKLVGLAVEEVVSIQLVDEEQIDEDLEKVSLIDHSSSPVKKIIRTEKGMILGLDLENLFVETGTIELDEIIDSDSAKEEVTVFENE